MCRRKHGEKAQKLVTLHQNTTTTTKKKHLQKRTGPAKRSASMSKPIKISSNEILTTICARLLDRLAQVHGGYGEHK